MNGAATGRTQARKRSAIRLKKARSFSNERESGHEHHALQRIHPRVEFDERDEIFVGRVLGVNSIISFHGESVTELRTAFVDAVDDYLADCKERGVAPDKPASGKLMLRIDPNVHAAISVAASAAGESIDQWSEEVLGRAAREVLARAVHA
ncbi:HicB family protein [Caballeronia pedi]|uniref:HicB family protein n=1 Tax=Caballeronia pedi TaxID=1777141 RepID=A0A158DB66_9BURK|nr:HicB family protein [Caballeronia pedi]